MARPGGPAPSAISCGARCPAAPVDPNQSFPALEEQVLERWRERDVFAESLRHREGRRRGCFCEGPPTANGKPGVHHVLCARAFKDIYPRYKTMRGHLVQRKGGWDCHGLPVEIDVEQQLGITSKHEIEAYGIAEFNAKCRESVFEYLEDWNRADRADRLLGRPRRTPTARSTPTYIESVWWALRQICDKGLLYEGHKVVPYCPRCGTALSSHELALGYKDVVDPSVYVRFPVAEDGGPAAGRRRACSSGRRRRGRLVSNAAVAVDPELDYVRAKTGALERARRARRGARRARAGRGRAGRRSSTASRARRSTGSATSRRSRYLPALGVRRARAHRPARPTS